MECARLSWALLQFHRPGHCMPSSTTHSMPGLLACDTVHKALCTVSDVLCVRRSRSYPVTLPRYTPPYSGKCLCTSKEMKLSGSLMSLAIAPSPFYLHQRTPRADISSTGADTESGIMHYTAPVVLIARIYLHSFNLLPYL